MGEVYRARDTRLERVVAIKVLSAGLSDDPRRRERFEREARVVSSLNHPHICALYDVGHQEGVDYLVMELLEGQTLSERLASGPLPLEQTLQYAVQISGALDAAHRKGIIHRDLKPANILLARSGGPSGLPTAKLLDFGIAKAVTPGAPWRSCRRRSRPKARCLARCSDMAPEQLEGREADARSDLFAFGAVLYEMLTGRRAFPGESQSKVIAAVLDSEPPPIATAQPLTPPALEYLVQDLPGKESGRALAERRRRQAAARVDRGEPANWRRAPNDRAPVFRWHPRAVDGRGSAGRSGGRVEPVDVDVGERRAQSAPRETRLEISTPSTTEPWSVAISPDGLTVVFVAESSGQPGLWVRPVEVEVARPLADTAGATLPFWSPDSQSIGFFAGGKLKRIDVDGSRAQVLADAAQPHGAAWTRDGSIIFSPHQVSPLVRVGASGGAVTPVTQFAPGHVGHLFPSCSRMDVMSCTSSPARPTFAASMRVSSTRRRPDGCWRAPRRLLTWRPGTCSWRETTVVRAGAGSSRLEITGRPVRVAGRGQCADWRRRVDFVALSASGRGDIVYRGATATAGSQLAWFDRFGNRATQFGAPMRRGFRLRYPFRLTAGASR